jgi:hypothetical protein
MFKSPFVRFIVPMKSLKPVAAQSGGEFLSGHSAAPLVKSALDAIRSRYLITYDPGYSDPGSGCAHISTELSQTAKARNPGAIVYGPRYRLGSRAATCNW